MKWDHSVKYSLNTGILTMLINFYHEVGYISNLCGGQYVIFIGQHFITNRQLICTSKDKILTKDVVVDVNFENLLQIMVLKCYFSYSTFVPIVLK